MEKKGACFGKKGSMFWKKGSMFWKKGSMFWKKGSMFWKKKEHVVSDNSLFCGFPCKIRLSLL